MSHRASFLGLGIFFIISTIALFLISTSFNLTFLSSLSLSILSFSIWYVQPDLKYNDERVKYIKQKSMLLTGGLLVLYIICLTFIVNFTSMNFNIEDILNILLFLIVITASISLIIYNKKY